MNKPTYEELEEMLDSVLDAHYGSETNHIGDGDGLSDDEANKLRSWYSIRLGISLKEFIKNIPLP